MITETSKLLTTYITLSPDQKKQDPSVIKKLIEKIKSKQREPFAKIFVTLHPMFLPAVLTSLNSNQIDVKNMGSDKNLFYLEL